MKKIDSLEVENSIQSEIDLLQLIVKKPNNYINDNTIKICYFISKKYG